VSGGDEVKQLISRAKAVVAFTGAGVAAESGIPTFRGDDGLWAKYSPSVYGTPMGLAATAVLRPSRLKAFVRDVSQAFLLADPNPGHMALGRLSASGRLLAVITQNIDDLHERGGAAPVIKLHGDLLTARCTRCKRTQALDRAELQRRVDRATGGPLWWGMRRLLSVYPRCAECGGRQRPHVVFFGESLAEEDCRAAERALRRCDLLIVSGTSGEVYPANRLPQIARRRGVPLVEISPEPTPYTRWADHYVNDTFAAAMPRLVD
jgi:NAD-dependent deacetylase